MTVLSAEQLAKRGRCECHTVFNTLFLWLSKVFTIRRSQTSVSMQLIEVSNEPESIHRPSGEKSTLRTSSLWGRRLHESRCALKSHTQTAPSLCPLATVHGVNGFVANARMALWL